MNHPDQEQLQRLVDSELGRRKQRKVLQHLEECDQCAEAVERIRATGDLLRLGMEEAVAEVSFDGFADKVLDNLETEEKLSWGERARAWLGEFGRYRQRVWAPPLALAGATALALIVVVGIGTGPDVEPPSSSVISVSFGSSVDGSVFNLEGKDGATTAVIWVDESKTTNSDSNTEARRQQDWSDAKATTYALNDTEADPKALYYVDDPMDYGYGGTGKVLLTAGKQKADPAGLQMAAWYYAQQTWSDESSTV